MLEINRSILEFSLAQNTKTRGQLRFGNNLYYGMVWRCNFYWVVMPKSAGAQIIQFLRTRLEGLLAVKGDSGEIVGGLVGMDLGRNSLDAVSVFVLGNNDLVIINVDGDFDRMIKFAL